MHDLHHAAPNENAEKSTNQEEMNSDNLLKFIKYSFLSLIGITILIAVNIEVKDDWLNFSFNSWASQRKLGCFIKTEGEKIN